MLTDHNQLTDLEFEMAFANASLSPALFNHEAHVRLAWIHVHRYGVEKAVEQVCEQLRTYTRAVGARDKFHHTLTEAAVRTVWHFYQKSHHTKFIHFLVANSRLKSNFKDLLDAHYSSAVLQNPSARQHWVEPDLQPYS